MSLLILGLIGSFIGHTQSQLIGGVDISKLPICAQLCLESNTASAYGCSITDIHCICSSIPYINALSCCLQNTCNATEQKAALAFDLSLCASYNVSIPDFLGCSPLSSVASIKSFAPATLPFVVPTAVTTLSIATVSTVTNIIPAFTTTAGGPIAAFTGQALLNIPSCTVAAIASYSPVAGGSVTEYPWVGCSPRNPGCCPWDLAQEGPLTVCPTDYMTTSGVCCPSGWSLLSTPLLPNLTPCYTTPALALVPPSVTGSSGPTAVSTLLFTLSYTLTTPPPPGLSTGAKVGIAIGATAVIALLAALLLLLRRAHVRRNARALRDATIVRTSQEMQNVPNFSPSSPRPQTPAPNSPGSKSLGGFSHAAGSPQRATGESIPELPSPEARSPGYAPGGSGMASPSGRMGSPGSVVVPVMELEGSTYIHQHHPMYVAAEGGSSPNGGAAGGGGFASG